VRQQDVGARGRHEACSAAPWPWPTWRSTSTTDYVHAIHGWLKLTLTPANGAAEASPWPRAIHALQSDVRQHSRRSFFFAFAR
jgi:hypothetical protein